MFSASYMPSIFRHTHQSNHKLALIHVTVNLHKIIITDM